MASMVNGPPEAETQRPAAKPQPKPPLKPKPLVLGHRKQDGTQAPAVLEPSAKGSGGEALANCPPVPARRRSSDVTAGGEVLSNSGNVRKMRELLQQALGLTEGEEAEAERSAQDRARQQPARTAPVPRARLPRTPRVTPPADPPVNGEDRQVPSAAKTAPSDVHLNQDDSEGLESEAMRGRGEAAGGPEANWRCASTCPCMCHLERPGMVLVWQPASLGGGGEADSPEDSQSDSSEEEGERTFRYVLHVNGEEEEEEDVKAARGPGWEDPAGLPSSAPVPAEEAVPGDGAHPEGSEPGAPRTLAPEEVPSPPGPGVVNQLPKPPRRSRPVGQRSLEGSGPAPPVPRRRLGQHQGPKARRLPDIRQRYTPAHLERISQCVDGLNLHIQQRQPSRPERGAPCTLPTSVPAVLKPPSPKVVRSAPPSPKVIRSAPPSPTEKQLQLYDVVDPDPDVDEDSMGNDYEVHVETVKSSSPETADQKMTDWESHFECEPLYQTYRETVINKEIKRQTLVRDASKTSEDDVYESILEGNEASPRPPDRLRGLGNSLWQNLSTVRQSGILNELSQRECRLQESMFEVLTSEASYLRSLNVLIEHFMENKDLNETIIVRDKKTLFSCITRVKEVSESFLKDLEDRVDKSIKINDVCDIIYLHAEHNFQVYVDYVRNQFYQEQKYSQLMEENAQFAAVVVRLQELPRCQRLPLMSFLLLPFQRITRIKMLLENILHRSEVGSVNEVTASKALGLVSKIIDECNREVGVMKQMEEMIHIGKKLEFDKLKAIPIISQLRHLEKRGEVSEIVFRENLFGVKPKVMALYLFLFNDLLVITNRKSGDRYQVVDHAHRSLVEVQECSANSPGAGLGNCFVLTLLENHQGKQCDRLLKTSTESDRHRWMDALMSGKQNLHEDSSDDKIYERWDCPQMQCLIAYTAQQADELSLDPADIINVTRKSPEGWYEGFKLSTGQRGWFPSANVQEITNEHVRRRNLRERYRLLQAAQHQLRDSEASKKADVPF